MNIRTRDDLRHAVEKLDLALRLRGDWSPQELALAKQVIGCRPMADQLDLEFDGKELSQRGRDELRAIRLGLGEAMEAAQDLEAALCG